MSFDGAFEKLDRSNRICKAKHANEFGPPHIWRGRTFGLKRLLDPRHGPVKIARAPRPACGMDAGLAAKRLHRKARVVGECRLASRKGRDDCLQPRVLLESLAGFNRLRDAKLTRGKNLDSERAEQIPELAELSLIMRRDHQAIAALKA